MSSAVNVVIPVPSDIVKTTGPFFLAYVFNWGLFGVLSLQTYQYYTDFPGDRWHIKTIVYIACVLETLQTFALTASGFDTFGYGFGDVMAVNRIGFGWVIIPITAGIVAFLAQSFYAYRISVLAQSHKFTYPIMLLSVTQLTASMVIAARLHNIGQWSTFMTGSVYILAGFWEGGNALCDVLITTCMIYYLRKRSTGVRRTKMILARLVNLTIGTGAMTAVIAIVTLLTTYIPTDIALYQATGTNLGKLYSVSMLVVLNARTKNRAFAAEGGASTSHEMSVVFPSQYYTGAAPSQGTGTQSNETAKVPPSDIEAGVRVHREVMISDDADTVTTKK